MNGKGEGSAKERSKDAKAMPRCCNGTSTKNSSARVMMKDYGGCKGAMNFAKAFDFCADSDLNLCTKAQIKAKITHGTGCDYDFKDVWLKDEETGAATIS